MTGSALIPELTVMRVILGMAGGTIHGRAFEYAIDMTALTSDGRMFTIKMERKFRVIYVCRLPGFGRMTRSTACPKLTVMEIIFLMTGKALLRSGLHVSDGAVVNMATGTFR